MKMNHKKICNLKFAHLQSSYPLRIVMVAFPFLDFKFQMC
jgi:hypothetical protein